MDDRTLEALKASIEKWRGHETASDPREVKIGSEYCPLCQIFILGGCDGCPVYEHTWKYYCSGTPYNNVDIYDPLDKFRAAARAEREFLESLLPEEG